MYKSNSSFEVPNSLASDEPHPSITSKAKRLLDLVGVASFLILFWWIIVIVAILVRITSGPPVIFAHQRQGFRRKTFNCLKFRSMTPNADAVLAEHLSRSPEAREQWNREFKLANDPRITRFGSLLRKSSLDELPQLVNILRGEMSLVGPRPVTSMELDKYYGEYTSAYIAVKPGLTGLWQVSGRSDLTYQQRVDLDVTYVRNWSLRLDLVIILKTFAAVIRTGETR